MSDTYYPPVGFYFDLSSPPAIEEGTCFFQEVSGISMQQLGTEQIQEGGENRFAHRVPGRLTEVTSLIVKRGMMLKDSSLAKWCIESINLDRSFKFNDIFVQLMDSNSDLPNPKRIWVFARAFPIKWTLLDSDPMNSEIAIETLEFSYAYYNILRG